ncbi:MAG: YhbY family RNA-binding protein [Desulfurococcaceae archaeon]
MDEKVHDKGFKERVRKRVAGKVDMQLGKSGITAGFLRELEARLKRGGVVKVKVLKSFRRATWESIDRIAEELAGRTSSRIYEIRGFTITLIKEK